MAVNVEIGAKTTGFSKGLAKMENEWAGFKGKLGRKFSFGDAGKGLMMGLGIGSVDQIASTFANVFQVAADAAALMAERTAATLQTTQQLIGLRQNPKDAIASSEKDMKGQERMIERQRQLVSELDSPLKYLSGAHATMFTEASRELARMEEKLGQSRVATEQMRIAEQKRQQTLRDSSAEIADQRDLLNKKTDPVGMAEREANRALRRLREGFGKPGGEERTLDLDRANLKVEQAKKERELAQLRGIRADNLARVAGGGGVYAPGGSSNTTQGNPAQAIVTEARKHTGLLTEISGTLKVSFKSPAPTTLK